MNHRIFERTLRPLVFQGACLFERHFPLKRLRLVVSDTLSDLTPRPGRLGRGEQEVEFA